MHGELKTEEHARFYEYEDVKAMINSESNADIFDEWDMMHCNEDQYWKLCSVATPWIQKLGSHTEYGVFCDRPQKTLEDHQILGQYSSNVTESAADLLTTPKTVRE